MFFFFCAFLSIQYIFGQKNKKGELGISVPVVWNTTEIYNSYSGARAKNISGCAMSYGANLTYSKNIYKSFFATIGIGYFMQKFGIKRPFDYNDPATNLLYWTDNYYYQCLQYIGGIGYNHTLNKNYQLTGTLTYNQFNTFRQVFKPDWGSPDAQVENKKYSFGKSIIISGGVNRTLTKRLSIGINILFPVYNQWRKDIIFRENANEFHDSKIVIGAAITASFSL